MLRQAVAALAALAAGAMLLAQPDGEQQPNIRINTDGHLGPIRALDIDAAGEFLVTAGDDKTARIWNAQTGQLLRVLRAQIGAGNDGALNAVAVSSDGAVVAAAGWSASNDVFLFDRVSGELIHRVSGLQNVTTRLAFSPDGAHLAIGQFGNHPLVIASSKDRWQRVHLRTIDDDGRGAVHGLSWSRAVAGELVAARSGGTLIRMNVTDEALRVTQTVALPAGAAPHRLSHSRDGRRVAVGNAAGAHVWIVDGRSLALQATLAAPAGTLGATSAVAWAGQDSGVLAAGGLRVNNQAVFARGASSGNTLSVSTAPLSSDALLDIIRVGESHWIAASASGEWLRFDAAGTVLTRSGSNAFDFRPHSGAWRVSADAQSFSMPNATVQFSMEQGWSSTKNTPGGALQVPTAQVGNARLSDYQDRSNPKWNARPIALDENERALTGAVHPKGDGALLGTQWSVRRIDASGKTAWSAPTTSPVWQTAWSGDGRWALIATGDGSVRWLRARDGAVQLTAFFHVDGKRWVAWTPTGYFATSPGGEDLIGWHINRGPDRAADYFPGSRLRASFYRPDVVGRVFAAGDETQALKLASEARGPTVPTAQMALPPVVRIEMTTPVAAGQTIDTTVSIRTPKGAPITAVRARQDGILLDLPTLGALPTARERGAEWEYELALVLPTKPEARQVSVFAENAAGASVPAVISLVDPSPPTPPTPPAPAVPTAQAPKTPAVTAIVPAASPITTKAGDLRPVLYVLSVGVADYKDKELKLDFSAKDAQDFASALKRQEGQLYRQVNVKLLVDKDATRDGVLDGLEWIRRSMTSRDVGMVFLAGHGVNDADDTYYFLPQDAQTHALKRTGVIFTEIRNTLAALPGKAMFFVDTCHSGNVLGGQRKTRSAASRDITRVVNELASAENGVIVFAASTGKQLAQEATDWKNGAFTLALVEGLTGKADFAKSGRITHKMLDLYVSERVKRLTEGAQSPVTIVPQGVPDFPLAISASMKS